MVYDHIVLLREDINKRLCFEAYISIGFVIGIFLIASFKISQLLANVASNVVPYGYADVFFICFLGIIVGINIVEFILFLASDYNGRFNANTPQDNNLLKGAIKV